MIRKTTWIIVLIFAVLLAAVFLWQRSQDEKTAEATPDGSEAAAGDQYLFDVKGEVAGLRIERVSDKAVDLAKNETGQWTLTGASPSPLDSAAMDSVIGDLAVLSVVSSLQNPPPLEDLGLNPPSYRILAPGSSSTEPIHPPATCWKTPVKCESIAYRSPNIVGLRHVIFARPRPASTPDHFKETSTHTCQISDCRCPA